MTTMTSPLFSIRKIAPDVHVITELSCVHSYLIQGREWALLVDSGLGRGDLLSIIRELTDRPIMVVNTHAHPDHVGGNHRFEMIALHADEPASPPSGLVLADELPDVAGCAGMLGEGITEKFPIAHHLFHGEVLDLGGRQIEIWHMPGHTSGSICLLDEAARLLFTGDTIYAGTLPFHVPGTDLQAFAASVYSLEAIGWETNLVLPGHGETPLDGGILLEIGAGVQRFLAGEGTYQPIHIKESISNRCASWSLLASDSTGACAP